MTPEEIGKQIAPQVGLLIALTTLVVPATGAIAAHLLHRPAWWGLVAGGWVLMGLVLREIKRTARRLAQQTGSTRP